MIDEFTVSFGGVVPVICLTALKVIVPEQLVPGEFMFLPYLDDKNYEFRKVLGTHIVYRDCTSGDKQSAQIALRAPSSPGELQYESDLTYSRVQRIQGQYVMAEAFLQ